MRMKNEIERRIDEISREEEDFERLESFGRCVVLRTAQWALDGRRNLPTIDEFRKMLIEIATEIGIASTKALAFTIRRIMAGTVTAPMLMSRATGTACSPAQTMAAGDKAMSLSVLTSTRVALRADFFRYSPTGLTSKLIEMDLCAAIRRAIRTGSRILWAGAGAFAVSCLHTRQISKVFPAATLRGFL